MLGQLSPLLVEDSVRHALKEDLGRAGDVTTQATIPDERSATAELASRVHGVVAGLPLAETCFRLMDPDVSFASKVSDGDRIVPGNPW